VWNKDKTASNDDINSTDEDSQETSEKVGFMSRLKKTLNTEIHLIPKKDSSDEQSEIDSEPKVGFFTRLKQGLNRTRETFTNGLRHLRIGAQGLDEESLEEVETLLLSADVGIESTLLLTEKLQERAKQTGINDSETLIKALQEDMEALLAPVSKPLLLPEKGDKPFVILMIGMNGAGKTTTIGKLAKRFQAEGRSVMLAAGDTFRAAAVEQLKAWGEHNNVPVIAQQTGSDSASVIYDALSAATARGIDVLIADTAGRLHTQDNLMAELEKVKRVMAKQDPNAPHETMLILDASIGQNALNQAKQFHQSIGLNGISVTKLDGTAKGGILFAVAKETGLPIRFIGVGEGVDDLRVFEHQAFIHALLDRDDESV